MKKNPIGRIVVRRGSVAELAVPCIVDPTDPELSGKGLTDQAKSDIWTWARLR